MARDFVPELGEVSFAVPDWNVGDEFQTGDGRSSHPEFIAVIDGPAVRTERQHGQGPAPSSPLTDACAAGHAPPSGYWSGF